MSLKSDILNALQQRTGAYISGQELAENQEKHVPLYGKLLSSLKKTAIR